jgi:hypothetical protein
MIISVEQLEKKKAAIQAAIDLAKLREKRQARIMKLLDKLGLLEVDEDLLNLELQNLANRLRGKPTPKAAEKEGVDESEAGTL